MSHSLHRFQSPRSRARMLAVLATTAAGLLATAPAADAAGATGAAPVMSAHAPVPAGYSFRTLDNAKDPTFNQLLGVNDHGVIAGYFGSGVTGHPNKGYTLHPPLGQADYQSENFPGSLQTQVTAINDLGNTVGFYADVTNANYGFVHKGTGVFTTVVDPATTSNPPVNQLLGINDHGVAVGFYNDAAGNAHGYEYDTYTSKFTPVTLAGASSLTATGINDRGAISGFATEGTSTVSFLDRSGVFRTIAYPGATQTEAFGINKRGQEVGEYVDASGAMHGFLWTDGTFQTIDDPGGVGTTTVNGINNKGDIVGFYVDSAGNTDGFMGVPRYGSHNHHKP